ncbi:hypothetical protein AFM11_33450 [Mycolicibacterium wolinskyi]|uniref:Phage gp6-like head-tail connector protein n=1 Tax=Mycolicibacterium wolinskyi TaxID=59750 RepID=A0A132PCC8_9MYCO|nr:hypothetical protein [Mycolicibacterium wolinskyi]KWX19887.1 hypothetical protein AFM11_33450 [Mycolicibacterium wolinskyi]
MSWQPPYAEPGELARFMGDAAATDNAELVLAIETASRSVDRICNRQFGKTETLETRYYTARFDRNRRRWIIDVDDFATVDGLIAETVGAQYDSEITGYLPAPVNAVLDGKVWTQLVVDPASSAVPDATEHGVRVTATWGWPAIPPTIKLATLIQASRLFSRRHAPFGVAGNPEVGQLRLLERLDPDVAISVRPFARVWGAV